MGDRDVRSDDRYLFLQTLMSARNALHPERGPGRTCIDGQPRNPAAPLAGELLATLDAAAGLAPDAEGYRRGRAVARIVGRGWCAIRCSRYDARYFDGSDPALFSYARRLRADGSRSARRRWRAHRTAGIAALHRNA